MCRGHLIHMKPTFTAKTEYSSCDARADSDINKNAIHKSPWNITVEKRRRRKRRNSILFKWAFVALGLDGEKRIEKKRIFRRKNHSSWFGLKLEERRESERSGEKITFHDGKFLFSLKVEREGEKVGFFSFLPFTKQRHRKFLFFSFFSLLSSFLFLFSYSLHPKEEKIKFMASTSIREFSKSSKEDQNWRSPIDQQWKTWRKTFQDSKKLFCNLQMQVLNGVKRIHIPELTWKQRKRKEPLRWLVVSWQAWDAS